MAHSMETFFRRAIRNVVAYGDTDIFPYPFENTLFNQREDDVVALLIDIHERFDDFLISNPPEHENLLVATGYNGFRWATQLDPFWNLYFLSLVIAIGESIEDARLSADRERVFSYRFNKNHDDKNLFSLDFNWSTFMKKSVSLSEEYKFVLVCDIADFYQRIYHHSLENALKQAAKDSAIIPNIMKFISNFSNTKSYSLPVGGPAARLLSELILNKTDRLLQGSGVEFCRFADDYHIFANDKSELYKTLIFLCEKLIINEGLSVQKSKTRIATTTEFQATTPILPAKSDGEGASAEDTDPEDTNQLLRLSLRFDPYSPTAEDDYEALKKQVRQFDVIGLLQKELTKSRIHSSVTRKLVQTLKYLDNRQKDDAVRTMINNAEVLYPIFGTVLISVGQMYEYLSSKVKDEVQSSIRGMILEEHYVMSLDVNIAYAIRILSLEYNPENESLLTEIFNHTSSIMIRRDIILIMAKWEQYYWLSDLRNRFRTLRPAERRAFIIAPYRLTDEGKHWRDHTKREFSKFEFLVRDWAKDRVSQHRWNIPI